MSDESGCNFGHTIVALRGNRREEEIRLDTLNLVVLLPLDDPTL